MPTKDKCTTNTYTKTHTHTLASVADPWVTNGGLYSAPGLHCIMGAKRESGPNDKRERERMGMGERERERERQRQRQRQREKNVMHTV